MPGRRPFLTSLALGGLAPLAASAEASPERPASSAAIDDLALEPAARADLERFAQPVLQEAAWLEELPLDATDPAFIFVPR